MGAYGCVCCANIYGLSLFKDAAADPDAICLDNIWYGGAEKPHLPKRTGSWRERFRIFYLSVG